MDKQTSRIPQTVPLPEFRLRVTALLVIGSIRYSFAFHTMQSLEQIRKTLSADVTRAAQSTRPCRLELSDDDMSKGNEARFLQRLSRSDVVRIAPRSGDASHLVSDTLQFLHKVCPQTTTAMSLLDPYMDVASSLTLTNVQPGLIR